MSNTERASVAGRAVAAGTWTVSTRLAAKLIDLAMLLCLARFLGPAEFGLVAMAMAAVYIVEALFELPTAAALIRLPELTADMLHTAFTLSLLRGLVIALLLVAVSWPLAAFNNEPRLTALLAVLALAPAMRGLVNPRMVEFARAFNFRPDAVMELSGKAIAFIVSVAIAVVTRSYWAIAAATVCAPLVATALSYVIAPLRPRLRLNQWAHFSGLIGWNFLSQVCAALNWQIDRLLLPRLTTTVAFGQYAMGKQMSEIPIQALIQPLIRPSMTALATSSDGRASRYLQLCRAIALVLAPVAGVLLLWPEALVRVALGPDWAPSAQWLRWITAVALLGLPGFLLAPLAMTLDRTRWMAVRTLIELIVRLPLVWIGALQWGIPGAIAGSAIATAAGTVATLFIVRSLIGAGLRSQIMTLARPALAMLPAAAVLWLAKPWVMSAASVADLLFRGVPVGVVYMAVYALAVWVAWRVMGRPAGLERYLLNMLRARLAKAGGRDPDKPLPDGPGPTNRRKPMQGNNINSIVQAPAATLPALVINGKFLQPATSRSGVYRVARELLVALDGVLASNPALAKAMQCRVIVPGGQETHVQLSRIRGETAGRAGEMGRLRRRISGVLWEQLALPRLAKGSTLVSLCNIGPVVHRDAFTMVHDAQVYSNPDSYSRAFRTWYRFVLPRLGKGNRGLLTVSDYSRKQLVEYGVAQAQNIVVIHNGCDHVLRLVPSAARIESAGLAGKRYVLALANTQPHKNIPVLLKAFHSPALRDVTLALFGPARREDFEAQGHAVPPNVKFLGFVSDEELAGLLLQATALAFPSTTEGFGLPPLEAMLLGCPTIVAPCGALPEVCGDAALSADAHDPLQWTRQIVRLCDDAALRQSMQVRGRAHAAQFTWERAAHRLLETVLGKSLADTGLMQAMPAATASAADEWQDRSERHVP